MTSVNGPVRFTAEGNADSTGDDIRRVVETGRSATTSTPIRSGSGATPTAITLCPTDTTVIVGSTSSPLGPCETTRRFHIAVRPSLSLAAGRNAVRDYSFTGRVLPGRGQAVALYRVRADGSRVLTARSAVQPDGTYRFDRRFAGFGRFGFETRVGESSTNLAGSSPVRPTVVH